jgi:hypothetical protein
MWRNIDQGRPVRDLSNVCHAVKLAHLCNDHIQIFNLEKIKDQRLVNKFGNSNNIPIRVSQVVGSMSTL